MENASNGDMMMPHAIRMMKSNANTTHFITLLMMIVIYVSVLSSHSPELFTAVFHSSPSTPLQVSKG